MPVDPINTTRLARALLGAATDDRPLIDRMTMLPVGQYPAIVTQGMEQPQVDTATLEDEFSPQRGLPKYDTRPGDLNIFDQMMIDDIREHYRGVPREDVPGEYVPFLFEPTPAEPPAPGNLISLLTNDRPHEPRVNSVPTGRSDPFDRNNDPWGEVPMIIENPFADPPLPELPRMPRPLPFLLGPVG